ncbi:hypothetical protein DM02DRAFT_701323 [Periconia macrospinosa]|uniref:Uncharacterized protein n=1 Tax=Periconia macrospinosa TaxID=97972 RepID=A0A2V1D2E6_9PLEO|nr:hypothetical protein DM02DRAFT_701323 [Periconia macrospinosa]
MATRPPLKPSKYSRRLLKVREEISKVKSRSGFNKSRIGSTRADERAPERWDATVTIFLSFCTVCEKQIVIPSDSILYCSERCRSQDVAKQPRCLTDYCLPTQPLALYPRIRSTTLFLSDYPLRFNLDASFSPLSECTRTTISLGNTTREYWGIIRVSPREGLFHVCQL